MTTHENYVKARAAAKEEGEYVTICPFCGEETVDLTGFIGICRIPVTADGWALTEGVDTDDEVFGCRSCEKEVPSEFVFAGMYDDPKRGGAREGSEQIAT